MTEEGEGEGEEGGDGEGEVKEEEGEGEGEEEEGAEVDSLPSRRIATRRSSPWHSSAEPYAMLESRVLYFFLLIHNVFVHTKTYQDSFKNFQGRFFFKFNFFVSSRGWQILVTLLILFFSTLL